MNKNAVLEGTRVRLRPLTWDDVLLIQRWSADPELQKLIGETEAMSDADSQALLRDVREDESRLWFAIEIRATGEVIGEAGLLRIFPAWATTDLSIIVGEPSARGKGYGTEAMRLLLGHAFRELKLHRVAIGVVGFNETALAFYEKIGFRREGVQRDGYFCDDRFSDFVMMSLLADEYEEPPS
jgi:RimJ/RimL family protein N-acetyltransferase